MYSFIVSFILGLGFIASFGAITANNSIVAIACLISVFTIAGILSFAIKIEFISLLFILVYVGAIAILFLFVIMCINIKNHSTLFSRKKPYTFIVCLYLLAIPFIACSLLYSESNPESSVLLLKHDYHIYLQWDQLLTSNTDIAIIGEILYFFNPLTVILIGMILVIAMVGCISIALFRSDRIRRQDVYTRNIVSFDKLIRFPNIKP